MARYFKLPNEPLYWKIIDEQTEVIQITNRPDGAKGISRTIAVDRYQSLLSNSGSWDVIDEQSFEVVRTSVLNYL